ncbi:hypothetical protein NMY22_g8119 [Coprinellus aureogranulatus]|nr:hypothetical protein NMY22_g8119 [Coprinellus aureogranulatus]
MTSGSKSASQCPVPQLPLELWHHIIELAAYLPDTVLDPTMERSNPRKRAERYNNTLSAKRCIVLVCHSWRAFATPLLYAHITISQPAQIPMLLCTLEAGCSYPGAHKLGELVRRMDILLSGPHVWLGMASSIRPILKAAPKLAVVNMNTPKLESWSPWDAFLDNSKGSVTPMLESFHLISPDPPHILPLRFFPFMMAQPRLQYLECNIPAFPRFNTVFFQKATGSSTFPSVEDIRFAQMWRQDLGPTKGFPPGTFPNLTRATIQYHTRASATLKFVLPVHGKGLRFLRLLRLDAEGNSLSRHRRYLDIIRIHCPRLKELSFSVRTSAQLPQIPLDDMNFSFPSIEILSVELVAKNGQFSKSECTRLLASVSSWIGKTWFPNIRTVRFVSESNILHLERQYSRAFNAFLQECASFSVLVEGHFFHTLNTLEPSHPAS